MHPLHCTFDAGSLFLNVFLFIQARTMGFVLLAFIGNFSALLKIELKLDFCISSRVIFGATRDRTYTTSSQSPLISDPLPPLVINFIMWAVGFTSQVKAEEFQNDCWCLRFLPKNEQKQVVIVVRRIRSFVFWKNSKTPKIISKLTDLYQIWIHLPPTLRRRSLWMNSKLLCTRNIFQLILSLRPNLLI